MIDKDDIMDALNDISDRLDNYDDSYYTKSEIRDQMLKTSMNDIIDFIDIISKDINDIRNIVYSLQKRINKSEV